MRRKREDRRKIRRLRLRTLFMLSITLMFNTYAWFSFVSTVSTDMQVHVDAWSVNFEVDDEIIEKELLFEIDHAYPGMDEVKKEVRISNAGDRDAKLSHKIVMIRVLNDTYVVESELTSEEKNKLDGTETEITQEEMIRMLEEDFPFSVAVETSTEILQAHNAGTVAMKFNWEYDSGNDELDTQYGVDSYKYYEENPDKSAIQIKIKVKAQQSEEET